MLNPEPETLAWLMFTFDPPELVTLWYWLALLPTCTLPKLLLVGFALNIPALAPAPVNGKGRVVGITDNRNTSTAGAACRRRERNAEGRALPGCELPGQRRVAYGKSAPAC